MSPGIARPIGVHLDPETVGIAQVDGFAHEVIGHSGALADLAQMAEEPPERGALRQQDREVVQPEPASARHGARARTLVQLDDRRRAAGAAESGGARPALEQAKPEHLLVVGDDRARSAT